MTVKMQELKNRADRLNTEYYNELAREIRESHTYIVEEIIPMPDRVIVGEFDEGNYIRETKGY